MSPVDQGRGESRSAATPGTAAEPSAGLRTNDGQERLTKWLGKWWVRAFLYVSASMIGLAHPGLIAGGVAAYAMGLLIQHLRTPLPEDS